MEDKTAIFYANLVESGVSQPLVQASLIGEAIDAGPVLVFVADEDMKYVAVNEYACRTLGYARHDLVGRSVTEVARYPEAAGEYAEMVASGVRSGTARLTRKDGGVVEVAYRATATTIAGTAFYVSVGWIDDGATERSAPPARRAPARG